MTPILLTPIDISIAATLIVLDAALSIWLKLRLHWQLALAAARMVVQLVAIGYVLRFIFSLNSPAATLLLILVMVLVAAREVAARPERRFKGSSNLIIGAISVGFATFVTAILALTTAIRPQPWFDPHYAIPLAGIILGNVLNSASLSLDSFLGSVRRERPGIEARLSLGESYRSNRAACARGNSARPVAHHQSNVCGRNCDAARHHDRSNSCGARSAGGCQIPDPSDVPVIRRQRAVSIGYVLSGSVASH
jgi:putative ABC transport system permease protein